MIIPKSIKYFLSLHLSLKYKAGYTSSLYILSEHNLCIKSQSLHTHTHTHTRLDHQFSSVAQSCLNLCDPMDCRTPSFPVHHQLPELTQTHVRRVSDAIQPSHPLSSASPPTFNLSQHQGLFQLVRFSYHVAKVLELQLQHQSFQ